MIKNTKLLKEFEKKYAQLSPPNFLKNIAIVEALLEEARLLGSWPPKDPMAGIETDIRIAKILNSVR